MIEVGSIVVIHLAEPSEKLWGLLTRLDGLGAVLRGIPLDSVDTWMLEVAGGETPSLGLSTVFVPMARIAKIYLDEATGQVPSYRERFEERVGVPVEEWLELGGPKPS
ncbi:MAG: hypothetical protein R3325_07515 [Thermoanaerobaculia bacterium]|nr:hypothetical protein [Thermoanaerobaculia bacterium]